MTALRSPWRRPAFWIATLLFLVYGVRAIPGLIGGFTYPKARQYIDEGEYERALPLLKLASVGFNKADALWWRANIRYGLWRRLVTSESKGSEQEQQERAAAASEELRRASADYLEALAVSPVAAWPWAGLAKLYDAAERGGPTTREIDMVGRERGSWDDLGREGLIAVGLLRKAIERNPSDFEFRDQVALTLHGYGLLDEALEAVEASARAQPAYHFHSYRYIRSLPDGWRRAFADASREMLGRVPMLSSQRHLVALGKLERDIGRLERAEEDLRRAVEERTSGLHQAEARFWLAQVFKDQGRLDEARVEFERTADEPRFRVASIVALSQIYEEQGDLETALRMMSEARRLGPRNIGYCLRYAQIARRLEKWAPAKEALVWAILIEPDDPRPHVELVELLLQIDDISTATVRLRAYERRLGPLATEAERLRQRIRAAEGRAERD